MIRPVTCVCMLLAGASGLYLYQSKHRAQLLDREIVRTIRATAQTRERVGMLRAEWALLNEPDRLAELSQQHLTLRTLSPQQFVPVTELASRLPVQPALVAGVEEDAPLAAAAPSIPRPAALAPRPTPAPQTSQLAARTPAPAREPPARQPASEPSWQPAPGGGYQLVTPAAPRSQMPIVPAYATPMAAPPPSRAPMVQRVATEPDYGARPAPAPFVGSALGGSRPALAAPVPVSR